jgi:hypothetical protein
MALARVASPFSLQFWEETDAPAPVRVKEWARERGRVAPGEWSAWKTRTPHLNPLPLAKGRGEQTPWDPQPANTAVLP